MQAKILLFSIVAGLLGLAQAVDVKICKDANLKGDCYNKSLSKGVCWNFPGSYNDKVSSVKVSADCTFYGHGGCRTKRNMGTLEARKGDGGTGSSKRTWKATKGTHNKIPGYHNDEFSAVRCRQSRLGVAWN